MPNVVRMTGREAEELADRLTRRGQGHSLAEEIAVIETQCRTAGRLIHALLKHVQPHDVFTLD